MPPLQNRKPVVLQAEEAKAVGNAQPIQVVRDNPLQVSQSGSGTSVVYKNKAYKVYMSSKSGRYILYKGKRVYI